MSPSRYSRKKEKIEKASLYQLPKEEGFLRNSAQIDSKEKMDISAMKPIPMSTISKTKSSPTKRHKRKFIDTPRASIKTQKRDNFLKKQLNSTIKKKLFGGNQFVDDITPSQENDKYESKGLTELFQLYGIQPNGYPNNSQINFGNATPAMSLHSEISSVSPISLKDSPLMHQLPMHFSNNGYVEFHQDNALPKNGKLVPTNILESPGAMLASYTWPQSPESPLRMLSNELDSTGSQIYAEINGSSRRKSSLRNLGSSSDSNGTQNISSRPRRRVSKMGVSPLRVSTNESVMLSIGGDSVNSPASDLRMFIGRRSTRSQLLAHPPETPTKILTKSDLF